MFVDSDIQRLNESLARNRDALRMCSLAFQWLLGDSCSFSQMGNAYASLATVLRVANAPKSQAPAPPAKSGPPKEAPPKLPEMTALADWADVKREATAVVTEVPRYTPSPTMPRPQGPSSQDGYRTSPELRSPRAIASPPQPSLGTRRTGTTNSEFSQFHFSQQSDPPFSDTASQTTVESLMNFEDMLRKDRVGSPMIGPPRTTSRMKPQALTEAQSETMKAALINAVHHRNHKVVEELLELGVTPDSIAEFSVLRQAVVNGDAATIRLLLLFGADANHLDENGHSPLMSAIEVGSLDAAKTLIKYGAVVEIADAAGESPLSLAASSGRAEFVQLLLSHGCDANKLLPDGRTPLVAAITKHATADVLTTLLQFGANPNGKDHEGKTPLFEALLVRRVDLITLLLDVGSNPNTPAPKHPLWPSTYEPKALELMISRGADVKKAPGIMELASSINSIESVKILLKAGVSPNIKKDGIFVSFFNTISIS